MLRTTVRAAVLVIVPLGFAWMPGKVAAQEAKDDAATKQHFSFREMGREAGLFPALTGIHGHGAAWGDVNGDGLPDLYVGTFHNDGPANLLLLNQGGKFAVSPNKAVQISTRATGVVLADLDNDGDLDLYVGSMPIAAGTKAAERYGRPIRGCSLFRNDGNGNFTDVSAGNGACPDAFGGRSVAVLDFDGDGLLDLLVGEDPSPGYNGSQTHSSRLFRNLGDLRFADVSADVGLTPDIAGLGVAAADVNNDTWPDIFLASGNRLFLNDGHGKFKEAAGSQEVFHWPDSKGDNMVCGVCIADVNRDGLLDIVLGQHFQDPWVKPVPNRLYLNRGIAGGVPTFEDVTAQVGLKPLPMKAPHVELQDFDNDGLIDLSCSIVKFADGRSFPLIFKNLGIAGGLPRFEETALAVNDFPNDTDTAIKRSGPFFEKMIAEGKIIYSAPGPVADFDRDGRLDIFMANWWAESPSLLLKNETAGGNWVDILVEGIRGVNRQGIGSRVNVYAPGKLGDPSALLCSREIAVGFGYASGQEAVAHVGLGKLDTCDVEVILPHGKGTIRRAGLKANQRVTLKQP